MRSGITSSYCAGRCADMSGSRMVIVCSSFGCLDCFHSPQNHHYCSAGDFRAMAPSSFRRYWRWKSRSLGGRPQIERLRALTRRMSVDNPLWGAPRINGELALRSLSPASRSIWSSDADPPPLGGAPSCVTHHPDIAAMELFIAPTIGFDLLFVLVIIRLERRNLGWINVTRHPTAEWMSPQVTEAFPWAEASTHL